MGNKLRYKLQKSDHDQIKEVLESSGFFYDFEVETAIELVDIGIDNPNQKDYFFILSEKDDKVNGWCCFGKTPCTVDSYDLYWIAVHENSRGDGVGRKLMSSAEEMIKEQGGKKVWVETSARELYLPTRLFYTGIGYSLESELKDFYADGDNKVTYLKIV
jgi:ribosomal protein S18 acetylase RimI-like enzyme